jgi:signal transduction histidine kinase
MAEGRSGPVTGVRLQLWRAVALYRVAMLGVALFLIVRWQHLYVRPAVSDAVGVGMLTVTAAVVVVALRGRAHRPALVALDALLTAALTVATLAAQTTAQRHGSMPTLTTFWGAGPALEAGIVGGWLAGAAAGLLQVGATVIVHAGYDGRTLGSAVLLVVAGGVVGYVATLTVRAEQELAAAESMRAAARERDRLARSLHDGVLQVLGLVNREGRDDAGRWGRIAKAAAEQEAAVRAWLAGTPASPSPAGRSDVLVALRRLASPDVTVSGRLTRCCCRSRWCAKSPQRSPPLWTTSLGTPALDRRLGCWSRRSRTSCG